MSADSLYIYIGTKLDEVVNEKIDVAPDSEAIFLTRSEGACDAAKKRFVKGIEPG